ncbi:MAG: 2-oxoglutarate dehydrogenase E1 component [Myxococcota bacterium]
MEDAPPVANLAFVESMYARFQDHPSSVPEEWRAYFSAYEASSRTPIGPSFAARSIFAAAAAAPVNGSSPLRAAPRPPRPKKARTVSVGEADPAHMALLGATSLFTGLGDDELAAIASRTTEVRLPEGDLLMQKGDAGDGAYFILEGKARVERDGHLVATLTTGQVVGEMSFLKHQVRSANVIAQTPLHMLHLGEAALDELLDTHAGFARLLFETVSKRLRAANLLQKRVAQLMRLYRVRGHVIADLDPLGRRPSEHPELDLAYHGLSPSDLGERVFVGDPQSPDVLTLGAVVDRMKNTYCRHIGVQFMHIDDVEVQTWLQTRMERTENQCNLSREEQVRVLTKLTQAELFEQFIHAKYLGAKRFSLEGAESLLPLLDIAIEEAAKHGVRQIVMGMAHRGRLNVLANIMGKAPHQIFKEFEDADPDKYLGRGDVKYHMGYSSKHQAVSGEDVHLSLTFNPSHLAFVTPVVQGRVRGKQDRFNDTQRERVMGLVIHGDAAFAGQGVIQESLNMSELSGYETGGTVHVIVNNQVGFTTDPEDSRSSGYATDVAKLLQIPIFHVNGEHPDAVAQVIKLAMDFRERWHRDVIIDMYCYRRHGHNEGDEPRYTQPQMYQWVDRQPTVRENFVENMVALGVVSKADSDAIAEQCKASLESDLESARGGEALSTGEQEPYRGVWSAGYHGGAESDTPLVETAVPQDTLCSLLTQLTTLPDTLKVQSKLRRLMKKRAQMASGDAPLDWWAGEALAFATLLGGQHPIRLSGQDAQRGTFTHRHSVIHDQESGETHTPLNALSGDHAEYSVWNSPLSEAAVLAFDYGYSLEWPEGLVIWEAQFGDFANGAQVIIDQFVTTSEDKWSRLSGLVMMLPHGFEGQGPEHSSARLERFLTLAAEDNIRVVNLTTPAQIFHALRRQVVSTYRKPLIIMTPKSLLRHPQATSSLEDLSKGGFKRLIPDASVPDLSEAPYVLLCSGKVYYDLLASRDANDGHGTPIVRIEQLYPFPEAELESLLANCPDGTEVRWVQEEPSNMGAWRFLRDQTWDGVLGRMTVKRVSRPESASPATGSGASHKIEQARLMAEAFSPTNTESAGGK